MSWLSKSTEHVKNWTNAYHKQREFDAALKRDRVRTFNFWNGIGKHWASSGPSIYVPDTVVPAFQNFLSSLEVPLANNPDSALVGLPLLQLYFGYSGRVGITTTKWDAEHKMLALALNAGLPVTSQMCELFVGCCELQTEFLNLSMTGNNRNDDRFITKSIKQVGHTYPLAQNLGQVRIRKLLLSDSLARRPGELSDKFLAGAQLLEVFGADWTQVSSGKTWGARLFEQLGHPEELKKYSVPAVEVDVNEIIAQKKRDKKVAFSNTPRLKL